MNAQMGFSTIRSEVEAGILMVETKNSCCTRQAMRGSAVSIAGPEPITQLSFTGCLIAVPVCGCRLLFHSNRYGRMWRRVAHTTHLC
jgi:hypothetical protein